MQTTESKLPHEPTIDQMIADLDDRIELLKNDPPFKASADLSEADAEGYNKSLEQERNMFIAIKGQLLSVRMYNLTHPHGLSKLNEIVSTLKKARAVIEKWHNFSSDNAGLPKDETARIWGMYERNSPEMKEIDAMIEWLGKEVSDGN
jgi:hypothetical protein